MAKQIELIQMKCPNCGANLDVNKNLDRAGCPYCGATFVVANNKPEVNITNNVTNIDNSNKRKGAVQSFFEYRNAERERIAEQEAKNERLKRENPAEYERERKREYIIGAIGLAVLILLIIIL